MDAVVLVSSHFCILKNSKCRASIFPNAGSEMRPYLKGLPVHGDPRGGRLPPWISRRFGTAASDALSLQSTSRIAPG